MPAKRKTEIRKPFWKAEQLEALRRCDGGTVEAAMAATGRSARAVEHKARELGMTLHGYRRSHSYVKAPAVRPAKMPKRVVVISRVEYCPKCHAPVSNWQGHFERTGHRREAA